MRALFSILFLILNLSASSHALGATPPEVFCGQLQDGRDQLSPVNRVSVIRDILRLTLAPGHLVGLKRIDLPVPKSLQVRPSLTRPNERLHLIFSLEPFQDEFSGMDLKALEQEQRKWNQRMAEFAPFLMSLIHARNRDACTEKIRASHFDIDAFERLLARKSAFRPLEQIQEGTEARRAISRALRKTRLRWTWIHSTDLNEVHQALANPRVTDLIIFAHGLSGGKILDSRGNPYPLGFFENLSPGIRSIGIFACHGLETEGAYALPMRLKDQRSERESRMIFLSVGSRLQGRDELVPMNAFKRFLRRIETQLIHRSPPLTQSTDSLPMEEPCRIRVDQFDLKAGTFGFFINGRFAGATSVNANPLEFTYPCRWNDRSRNLLIIQSLGTWNDAHLGLTDFTVRIQQSGADLRVTERQDFRRTQDHSYQGSRIGFELLN